MYSLLPPQSASELERNAVSKKYLTVALAVAFVCSVGTILLAPVYIQSGDGKLADLLTAILSSQKSQDSQLLADDTAQVSGQARAARLLDIASETAVTYSSAGIVASVRAHAATLSDVRLTRVGVMQSSVTVSGVARTRAALLAFQELLKTDEEYSSVILPLSDLSGTGKVFPFTMTLKVRIKGTDTPKMP